MKRFVLLSALLAVIAFAAQAQSGNRYALVIGNARYQSIEALTNPVNDATDIAAKPAPAWLSGGTQAEHEERGHGTRHQRLYPTAFLQPQ